MTYFVNFLSEAFIEGFSMTAVLIIAIGAQNAFVLKQGLRKKHVFLTASLCVFLDGILISLGVLGVGLALEDYPQAIHTIRWAGAIFMFCYAAKLFYNAATLKSGLDLAGDTSNTKNNKNNKNNKNSRVSTILAVLAFTLLNPHAYIDTIVLLGSVGGQYPANEHASFIIGALLASTLWFYGIGYGSRYLAPFFKRPTTWRILDLIMGFVMLALGYFLLV